MLIKGGGDIVACISVVGTAVGGKDSGSCVGIGSLMPVSVFVTGAPLMVSVFTEPFPAVARMVRPPPQAVRKTSKPAYAKEINVCQVLFMVVIITQSG